MHTDSRRERGSQRWLPKGRMPEALGRAKMSQYKALVQGGMRGWVRRCSTASMLDNHE